MVLMFHWNPKKGSVLTPWAPTSPACTTCSLGSHWMSGSSATACTPGKAAAVAAKLGSEEVTPTTPMLSRLALMMAPVEASAAANSVLPLPWELARIR
jgi:hypothetical protein